jgi:hypothetical protein
MILKCSKFNKYLYAITIAGVFVFNALWTADVIAAQEENQVYLDEFTEPGKYGLDLHSNYVASGRQGLAASSQPTNHQLRVTPEFSYGLNSNWDMAAYWLTVRGPGGSLQTDGVKVRAKWRPESPSADLPFYWAVNFEVGQLSKRFYQDQTSGEIKLIGVWRTDPWTLGMNFNFDRALKNHPIQSATSEIDTKIAYQIREGLQVGIENYSFLGAIHNDPGQPQSSQANYLAADFNLDKWDFNVGIGHASGQSLDKTVLKAIIGVPF